jgi:gas vesicle protein
MNSDRIFYSRDAETQVMRKMALLALLCLTSGLGIGAALALLFSPASGKTNRHELAKGIEDGLQASRNSVEPLVKRVENELADLRK